MVCPDFGWLLYTMPTIRSRWTQWVVTAACHCYSWWRWWSDTLWMTLIRLWLHLLLCYVWIVVVEISLQFLYLLFILVSTLQLKDPIFKTSDNSLWPIMVTMGLIMAVDCLYWIADRALHLVMSFFILVVVLLREIFLIGTSQEGKEKSTRKQTPSFMNRIQRNQLLGTLKNRAAMITGTRRLVDLNSNSGIKHGGRLGDLGMHTGKPMQPVSSFWKLWGCTLAIWRNCRKVFSRQWMG